MALPRDGVPPLTDADIEEFDHLKIQMEDIISATDNFNPTKLIGRGGFGPVYKGELSLLTGPTMVAFKRLDPRLGQGNIEFWKEILMLSDCKHENLVSLLHFSIEGDERVLVYEYASHGSLDHYLSDSSLTWEQRLHICIGVAHSLKYLHDPMKTQQIVLHRDIKSANILLDEQWNAKVSDFGLSKIWPSNQTRSYLFSHPVGTQGYCDPLYGETGFLSKESDVYSFGVVLFEVLCGRLCYKHRNGQINGILVHDWKRCYHEKKLDDIILKDLKEQINPDSLITFSTIANQCLNGDRRERPTMDEIVKELEVALEQQNIAYNRNLVEISKLAVPPLSYRSHDELILLLSKGILVDQGKRWLSINKNKKVHEMISAAECVKGFVFQVTAEISRFSKIFRVRSFVFKVEVRTQFLSTAIPYTINLIFKPRIKNYGIYIPFKYKLEEETDYLMSGAVHQRKDGWLMAELYQFTSYQREHDFKIEFLSDSITFSRSKIEGIEFRPMEHLKSTRMCMLYENLEDKNEGDVEQISTSDADWEQKVWPNYIDLINLSKDYIKWTTKKEHYFLLRKGFLIDNGEDKSSNLWLSFSKKMKIRLMISARAILVKGDWIWKSLPETRFEVVAEFLDQQRFEVFFRIKSELLSPVTYSGLLIYKLPKDSPLHDNLIKMESKNPFKRSQFFLARPPPTPVIQSMVDQNYESLSHPRKIKGYPKLRKDGWMELSLFKVTTDATKTIEKSLMFMAPNNMRGLVIQGIEFRSL